MPTFELSGPDGGTYQIDADTAAGAVGVLGSMFKQPEVGMGEDLGNVLKAAPGRAVASIAGIPGDLLHLGTRALGDNLTPESAYGSNAINKALGSDYEAKTEPGRISQKTLDFVPALIGGPETLAVKALTRVAAPVAASEVGRAVGGPYGEIAGALGGAAVATTAAQRIGAASRAAKGLPTGEQLVARGSQGFDDARAMDVVVKPDFVTQGATEIRDALKGHNPNMAAPVFQIADRLEALAAPVAKGMPPTAVPMNEVEFLRQELSKLRMSADSNVRGAASEALRVLNKKQAALTAADAVSGDAALYSKTIRDAVGDYGAGRRSQVVTGKQDWADLSTATAGSGANGDNRGRQTIAQLNRPLPNTNVPAGRRLGFNDAELAAAERVSKGGVIGNTARYIGKLAPTGSVSAFMGAGAGYGAAGPAGAVALPAVGYIAKKIGDMSTKRAIAELDALVRSRSPLAQQVAASLPPAIVQGLPVKTKLLLGVSAFQPIVSTPQRVPANR